MDPLQVGDVPEFDTAAAAATPPSALHAVPDVEAALLTLLVPTRVEAAALRRGLGDSRDIRTRVTGAGPRRSRRAAIAPEVLASRAIAVAGLGTPLSGRLRPGEVVVVDEVRTDALTEGPVPATRRLAGVPQLAAALRDLGLSVHTGAAISTDRLGDASARERLGQSGALIADCETAWLLNGRQNRPMACVRVVSGDGLIGLGRALRTLPKVASGLADWATTASA